MRHVNNEAQICTHQPFASRGAKRAMQEADAILARATADSFATASTRLAELEALGERHRIQEAEHEANTLILIREVNWMCIVSTSVVYLKGAGGVSAYVFLAEGYHSAKFWEKTTWFDLALKVPFPTLFTYKCCRKRVERDPG